jgi:hypothetical protein
VFVVDRFCFDLPSILLAIFQKRVSHLKLKMKLACDLKKSGEVRRLAVLSED